MFGPLTFNNSHECWEQETTCLLCDDSFNLHLGIDIFAMHLLSVHECVIEDLQKIKNLPEYIKYWRNRLKVRPIAEIIPSVQIDQSMPPYYLFSTLLKEDRELRHKFKLDFVMKVYEFERTQTGFVRQCLFCKLEYEGTRQGYLEHLSNQHNLQLGNPQNLVFIEELIDFIDEQLQKLQCIYCRGSFQERHVLKEHMRKKLHKRINPEDSHYDQYYIVNYLEVNKTWRAIDREDDRYALGLGEEENGDQEYSDWNENADKITCLFCTHTEREINQLCIHMTTEHQFDFAQITQQLTFYQKIKLVNYIRKMGHNKCCYYCNKEFESKEELLLHLTEEKHFKIPELTVFDQPEYYFPTYENDTFLYLIDDVEEDSRTLQAEQGTSTK